MLTPEQQETLKTRLDALGVQPEKPRNWKPYIQIGSDFYDVAEVLAAALGAIDEPLAMIEANGGAGAGDVHPLDTRRIWEDGLADEKIADFSEMVTTIGINDNRAFAIFKSLYLDSPTPITSIDDLTTERIDALAQVDDIGVGTVASIQTYMRERQA